MDSSRLADRLRGILKTPAPTFPVPPARPAPPALEQVLGGQWRQQEGSACFVVERRSDPDTQHGREPIATIAARLADGSSEAPLVAGGAPVRAPFVFFDLETTGLSGGAGTHAFLVGCGVFDGDGGFRTRQFLLARYADERPFLGVVAGELASAGALVSFNGKSFDLPVLETRYLFHRLEWSLSRTPHLDVLHPARRFWSRLDPSRSAGSWPGRGERRCAAAEADIQTSCSLMALEAELLGARRTGDVPGFEIPSRYFQFVRTGDATPLVSVFEHNRWDLLSLAGLTARLLQLVRVGPDQACSAREALALGRLYEQARLDRRAREAYIRAAAMSCSAANAWTEPAVHRGALAPWITLEALRSLALLARRARQFDEAATWWRQLLEVPCCPVRMAREANEALAIHHEHRARDLAAARSHALRSLDGAVKPAWSQAVQHRLSRIEKKMGKPPRPAWGLEL